MQIHRVQILRIQIHHIQMPSHHMQTHRMQIHARKMNISSEVNFEELGRCTDDFNGAQLKAVCVEAGMLALRREATEIQHEDFIEGITAVQTKKKVSVHMRVFMSSSDSGIGPTPTQLEPAPTPHPLFSSQLVSSHRNPLLS